MMPTGDDTFTLYDLRVEVAARPDPNWGVLFRITPNGTSTFRQRDVTAVPLGES